MKQVVFSLLNEAQQKMSSYAIYMNYKFIHFCIKAEPAALLSITVDIKDEFFDLEKVADVAIPEENQFAIIPKDQAYLFAICKATGFAHPEYKIEQRTMDENESEEQDSDGTQDKYILCTMPEVNKERRDAGMEYVKAVYDETIAKIKSVNADYGAKITKELAGSKPKEIDEAKEELQKLHDKHADICKSYREEKEKQIEEAYQVYLKEQTEKENAEKEKQAAHSTDAGKQFNMGNLDPDTE